MHALPFNKYFAFFSIKTIYDCELLVSRIADFFKCVISLYIRNKIVLRFRAGDFAGSTPDTPGCVDKYSNEFLIFFFAGSL